MTRHVIDTPTATLSRVLLTAIAELFVITCAPCISNPDTLHHLKNQQRVRAEWQLMADWIEMAPIQMNFPDPLTGVFRTPR
jgi:hypothetical protein